MGTYLHLLVLGWVGNKLGWDWACHKGPVEGMGVTPPHALKILKWATKTSTE